VSRSEIVLPKGAVSSTVEVRVPFFDTDAMGIVHHANYVRYLELARVRLLEEHQRPYTEWLERGLHFAVTRVEVEYQRAARFDDRIRVTAWVRWVRGASLAIGYVLAANGETLASGTTEHAMVDDDGRLRRIPRELRQEMAALVP
jgi:acyl-CoA thioester hydrolase